MSVRSTKQPPQAVIPRADSSVRGPQQQPQKEPLKPDAGKSAPQSGGASQAAPGSGFSGLQDKHEPPGRAGLERLQGEAARSTPHGQGSPAREAAPVAPELPQQRKTTDRESAPSERPQSGGGSKLRAVVMDRILLGMKDAQERLVTFAKNPGRLGVVNLSMAIAESAITSFLWKEPSTHPARRASLAGFLGLPTSASDAALLRELMREVHQAFVDFQASTPWLEAWRQYDEVLQRYETIQVQPVLPGHDTGPMREELQRLGIPLEPSFTRSLLLHPLILGVGLTADEGSETQVMIAGLTVAQLGSLVAHMRRLNPRLTNRLVRQLLFLATTDKKQGGRKSLGDPDLEDVQGLARQLLRLQVTHQLFV